VLLDAWYTRYGDRIAALPDDPARAADWLARNMFVMLPSICVKNDDNGVWYGDAEGYRVWAYWSIVTGVYSVRVREEQQ